MTNNTETNTTDNSTGATVANEGGATSLTGRTEIKAGAIEMKQRPVRRRRGSVLLLVLATCLMAAAASTPASGLAPSPAVFVGTHGDNWFDPANWSTGRVPDASTDVSIVGRVQVVIDPAKGRGDVQVRDLLVGGDAVLTTLAGTIMRDRNEVVTGGGQIVHRSTESYGDTIIVSAPAGCTDNCGLKLNPTAKSKRVVDLQSSSTVDVGLGGTIAAGPGQVGVGHHATLLGDTVTIGGVLRTSLYYGFTPSAGDRFQIVTATRSLTGRFDGLPEGAVVASYADVLLRITYAGGDGNDVVLEAISRTR